MPHSDAVLTVNDLTCERGEQRLFEGVSFTLRTGRALRVAAPNGRGKTTLLRTLAGLRSPSDGTMRWSGSHASAGGYAGDMLYLAHENALNPDLSPSENLVAWMALYGVAGDAGAALARVGLGARLRRVCRTLSAGQRRRAALARLCLSSATLWLLDEPAAALDTQGRRLVGELIGEHVNAGGIVVFTTHEPLPDLVHETLELAA